MIVVVGVVVVVDMIVVVDAVAIFLDMYVIMVQDDSTVMIATLAEL